MKRTRTFMPFRHVAPIAVLAVAAMTALEAGQAKPPAAPERPVTETLHGVTITDPYRWMEEGDEEFTAWLKAQDAYTRSVLARIPGREKLLAELRALTTDAGEVRAVDRVGNRYVYLKRDAGGQVPKLYVRDDVAGPERLLIDPAKLGDRTHRFTISEIAPSPDGRYVALHIASGGGEIGRFRVVDIAAGRMLDDTLDRAFYFDAWRPDGRAFAYTRLRDLPPDAPSSELELCATTYLHVVGTEPRADQPLLGCDVSPRIPVAPNQMKGVLFSSASTYALAWVALDAARTRVAFYTAPVDAIAGPVTPWRPLAGADDQVSEAVLHGDTAYIVSHRNAPRGRVVRVSIVHADLAAAATVVPSSDALVAPKAGESDQGLFVARDGLYVRLWDGGTSRLVRVPFGGSAASAVPLPFRGTIQFVFADPGVPGVVFSLESWTRARRFYAFDPTSARVRDLGLAPPHPADRAAFKLSELKVRSADGTLVPLSIVGPPNLRKDGSHPAVVEAYGAYGRVYAPVFRPSLIPLLERGGIYAVCHARGGGEYGEAWHLAGQRSHKANTIADFIACAEYLVGQHYTTKARLAGVGGSAGGLAIGGLITRRPDLFAAAFPMVPVADLLRFEFWRNGPANIPEFGSVKDPDDFRAMLAVSPYEHIEKGTRYPAVLVTTGINDRRVAPWQAAKFVARLQAATASGKPVLLRVDWGTGHGIGTTAADQEAMLGDAFSFLLWQMGLSGFQPHGGSR
jgi:prolyl oligopeptidase